MPRWFLWAALPIVLIPAVTLFVNHSAVQTLLLNRLKADTGVEVAAIRLHVFPRMTVEFWDLAVRNERDGGAVFRSRHGALTLRWLALLKRRLAIVKAVLDEPQLVVVKQASGEWRVPIGTGASRQPGPGAFTWDRRLPDLQINRGEIRIIGESRPWAREAAATDITVAMETDLFRAEADVLMTARVGGGDAELSGSLLLIRASADPLSAEPEPYVQFEGRMDLNHVKVAPWLALFHDSFAAPQRTEHVDISGRTVVHWGPTGYGATLSRVEARLGWIAFRAHGDLRGRNGEYPSYSATASSSPVALETLLQHIPPGWIPPEIRSSIQEHELAATLELVSATASGQLPHLKAVDWKGVVKLSQGEGLFGSERIRLQNLSGSLFVDSTQVEAMNLSGRMGEVALSDGTLRVSHLDVAPNLDLQVAGIAAIEALAPLLHAFGGAGTSETVLRTLKGEMQFLVQVAGPLVPEARLQLVKAELRGRNVAGRLPDWNLAVEHMDAAVDVTPGLVNLKRVRGSAGPIAFDIEGPIELGSPLRLDDVTVSLSSEGSALSAFLFERLPATSSVSLDGPVQCRVRLSGSVQDLVWQGHVDLGQADIGLPAIIEKRRGLVSAVEFEGKIVRLKRISVRRVAVRLPSALVESRAEVRLGTTPRFTSHIRMEPTALTGLADTASGAPVTDGLLRASLTLKGQGLNWTGWTMSGWIELKHGALTAEGLRDPLRALSFRLLLDGRNALIDRLAFKIGESDVRVRGMVEDWLGAPTARLTLESSKLDLTRLLRIEAGDERGGPAAFKRIRRWTESGRADVAMMIGQAHYRRLTLRALSGRLTAEGGRLELTHLVGETPKGLLKGHLRADMSQAGTMDLHGELDVSGVPIHHLTALIDPDADPVRGILAVKGALSATVGGDSSPVKTLRILDPLHLRIDEGRVIHGTVLPKVLKILNLPALLKERVDLDHSGIPFDRVSATVTAEDGVLRSENIVFDSPVVEISAAGTLDMAADELDLALAVSPLEAYADLVENIPLFGTLFAGDRPGLTTALFEVKGPRRDPDVRYLPIESIATGLTGYPRLAVDVLLNAVTLPQKLLEPLAP